MDRKYRSNCLIYYIRNALGCMAYTILSGTTIQMFLAYVGASSGMIGLHASIINITSFSANIISSSFVDKTEKVKNFSALSMVPYSLIFLAYLPFCLMNGLSLRVTFALVCIMTFIQVFFQIIHSVFEYKLPYLVFDLNYMGRILAIDLIVSGGSSILLGIALNYAFSRFEEVYVYIGAFLFAFVAGLLVVVLTGKMKVFHPMRSSTNQKKESCNLFKLLKMPVFNRVISANFLRGVSTGFVSIAAVFAMKKGFDSAEVSYLVTAASAGQLAAGCGYALLSHKYSNNFVTLMGSFMNIGLVIMGFCNKIVPFLIFYLIAYMGKICIDSSLPAIIYEVIPYEMSGTYNIYRVATTFLGTALSAAAGGYLVELVPAPILLAFAAACQIACGLIYYYGSWQKYGMK